MVQRSVRDLNYTQSLHVLVVSGDESLSNFGLKNTVFASDAVKVTEERPLMATEVSDHLDSTSSSKHQQQDHPEKSLNGKLLNWAVWLHHVTSKWMLSRDNNGKEEAWTASSGRFTGFHVRIDSSQNSDTITAMLSIHP